LDLSIFYVKFCGVSELSNFVSFVHVCGFEVHKFIYSSCYFSLRSKNKDATY